MTKDDIERYARKRELLARKDMMENFLSELEDLLVEWDKEGAIKGLLDAGYKAMAKFDKQLADIEKGKHGRT